MKYFSHLNTAVTILTQYQGAQPFGIFLKDFFRQHKKYGSKDRKSIGHLCYCYFRTGKALLPLSVEEKVVAGLFLCTTAPDNVLGQLKPEWNEEAGAAIDKKCSMLNIQYPILNEECSPTNIFPWKEALSEGIDHLAFAVSFLTQPQLFLRVRPGQDKAVMQKLNAAGITYTDKGHHCFALPNASKVDEVITINKEVVVQDYSSQRVREFLALTANDQTLAKHKQPETRNPKPKTPNPQPEIQSLQSEIQNQESEISLWDCCAASGGKSILAYDVLGNINLTVSDVRESIIANLRKRFAEAGILQYHAFVADLSDPRTVLPKDLRPQLIIADVPCSGSGTWGRTPEQLYYFETAAIKRYSDLQRKIVSRVIPQLVAGGHFLYITCSVFKEENEEAVAYIQEKCGLQLVKSEVLKGYDQQADTMFAALFTRPA